MSKILVNEIGTWTGTEITLVSGRTLTGSASQFKITGGTAGQALITDGAGNISFGTVDSLPSQTGQVGKFLKTDGTNATWDSVTPPTATVVSDQANTSTGYFDVPAGTTAQRPGSPATGNIRLNTTLLVAEIYNDGAWIPFAGSVPTISGISPTTSIAAGTTIQVTGTNFQTGATVAFIGTNLVSINASSTTVDSAVQITCTTPILTVANEPYDVKVTNTNGGSATLDDALDAGGVPIWTTAAGSLGTIGDLATGTHFTLVATDPDGQTVTFAETTSVLTTAGLTLNSTTGAITGDPTDVSSLTTYNFTVEASDGLNTTSRAFSFVVAPAATGGTITTFTDAGVNYRIHTFTSNGTFTSTYDLAVDVLIVAGGASGGNRHGGGGGAGGLIEITGSTIQSGAYVCTIGDGGVSRVGSGGGYAGSNTTFVCSARSVSETTNGGGGGASYGNTTGDNGGSGGGAGPYHGNVNAGLSTATQGNPSMTGFTGGTGLGYGFRGGGNPGNHAVGGGGGAGGVGGNALDLGGGETSDQGGVGGNGRLWNLDGNSYYYAGGGGGGGRRAYHGGAGTHGGGGAGAESLHGGTHGIGGGSAKNSGQDGYGDSNGGDAGANTGSGGGGQSQTGTEGYSGGTSSGAGGSGIVVIRYVA